MKVLQIATHFGTTSVYNDLFQCLQKMGLNMVYIVSHRNFDYLILGNKYFKLPVLPKAYRMISSLKARIFSKSFKNLDLLEGVDMIHAHTVLADGLLGVKIKTEVLPHSKLMVTVRSTDIKFRYKYFFWERSAFRKVLDTADVITVLSPAYKRRIERISDRWSHKIEVIPNGIFFNKDEEKQITELNSSKDILFVGRLIPRKNVSGLIKAYLNYVQRNPDSGDLYLVGEGTPGKYLSSLKSLSSKTSKIHFIGKLKKEETLQMMKKCKVLVAPSFSESFGLVYIEALSQRMLIIGSHDEGIDGFFSQEQGCAVVKPNSVNEISASIEKLLDMKEREEVDLSSFDWNNVAEKYSRSYL